MSLSCTLGPFLSVSAFAMQRSFVGTLRNASKYAPRLAGLLLLLSGGYAIWYRRYEFSVYDGNRSRDALVDAGTNLQIRFVQLTQSVGAEWIALAIVAITTSVHIAFRLRNRGVATLE